MSDTYGKMQLPPGWAVTSIEALFATLHDGRTLHQGWSPQCEPEPSTSDDEWAAIKTTAIQPGSFHPEHNKRLPKNLEPRPQIEVKAGDLLITCAGPRSRCGVACLVRSTRPRLMISGKMYRFRVDRNFIEPRFIEGFLQTSEAAAAIDAIKTGGSDSGLNLTHKRFRPLPIRIAPLAEQRRIVDEYEELLTDLDAGVEALKRVQVKLGHYRAAVLKAAVEGALTADWREQHPDTEPASELLKRILTERRRLWEEAQLAKFKAKGKQPSKGWQSRYKEPAAPDTSTLPALPHGWCWATMDQLAWDDGYGTSVKCRETNAGLPVLRIPNIIGGRIDLGDLKFAPPDYVEEEPELVHAGDLLVVRTNGSRTLIGRGAVVQVEPERKLAFASYLIRLRLPKEASLLKWVAVLWESWPVRRWIETHAATSAGQFNISLGTLETLAVPLPPTMEQDAAVDAVEDQLPVIDHLEADVETRLLSVQALRQSILRHAFTGQLVPQDPHDEPASELLKRIAIEREARISIATKKPRSRAKTTKA